MKKFNVGTITLVTLISAAYVYSSLNKERNHTAAEDYSAAHVCDPNYSGCVPVASDVDCAGGGGNGPEYVKGPIQVIGQDIYNLDRDGDGIACE